MKTTDELNVLSIHELLEEYNDLRDEVSDLLKENSAIDKLNYLLDLESELTLRK